MSAGILKSMEATVTGLVCHDEGVDVVVWSDYLCPWCYVHG